MLHTFFKNETTYESNIFIIFTLFFSFIIIYIGYKKYKNFIRNFISLIFAIFLIEGVAGRLWIFSNLSKYGYIHNDISWLIILLWGSLIICFKIIYDSIITKKSDIKKFLFIIIGFLFSSSIIIYILNKFNIFTNSEILKNNILFYPISINLLIYLIVLGFIGLSTYLLSEKYIKNKQLIAINKSKITNTTLSFILFIFIIIIISPLFSINNNFYIFIFLIITFIGIYLTNLLYIYLNKYIENLNLYIQIMSLSSILGLIISIILDIYYRKNILIIGQNILDTYTKNTIKMPFMEITDIEFIGAFLLSYIITINLIFLNNFKK